MQDLGFVNVTYIDPCIIITKYGSNAFICSINLKDKTISTDNAIFDKDTVLSLNTTKFIISYSYTTKKDLNSIINTLMKNKCDINKYIRYTGFAKLCDEMYFIQDDKVIPLGRMDVPIPNVESAITIRKYKGIEKGIVIMNNHLGETVMTCGEYSSKNSMYDAYIAEWSKDIKPISCNTCDYVVCFI